MNNTTYSYIDEIIKKYKVIVFIKGEKSMPMCGFSNTVVEIFNSFNIDYHTINVLEDNKIRNDIKLYSQWPTIPQVYINGEFIGGADIIIDLYNKSELQTILEKYINS